MVGRVKLYISALQLENGELLLVVSPQFNPMLFRIMHYAGKLKPYSVVSKDAGLILKIRA
ncbi:iS4 family transposase ORF 2 [Acinetobacter baumannii 1294222]|nr:iS4 family transposase ORF 2 [Acinetobacter baumannii 1294222]